VIDGDAVVHELVLPAPPDEVFDMFVDAEKLVRWIGISAELEPRPGGRFRFEVMPGEFCEGHYVILDRPRLVVFTWGWTNPTFALPPGSSRVEVTFEPHGPSGTNTRLRLVHHGLTGDGQLLHDDGWGRFLARLGPAITGTPPPEYPTDQPAERLEQLRGDGPPPAN
jgi:uncharacterized protein YndB with AHSA1/START domain